MNISKLHLRIDELERIVVELRDEFFALRKRLGEVGPGFGVPSAAELQAQA